MTIYDAVNPYATDAQPCFRRDAVAMVLDESQSIAEVGRRLGVNEGTLGNWVAKERIERGEREGLTGDERAELTELRAEIAQLRMERGVAGHGWYVSPGGCASHFGGVG